MINYIHSVPLSFQPKEILLEYSSYKFAHMIISHYLILYIILLWLVRMFLLEFVWNGISLLQSKTIENTLFSSSCTIHLDFNLLVDKAQARSLGYSWWDIWLKLLYLCHALVSYKKALSLFQLQCIKNVQENLLCALKFESFDSRRKLRDTQNDVFTLQNKLAIFLRVKSLYTT